MQILLHRLRRASEQAIGAVTGLLFIGWRQRMALPIVDGTGKGSNGRSETMAVAKHDRLLVEFAAWRRPHREALAAACVHIGTGLLGVAMAVSVYAHIAEYRPGFNGGQLVLVAQQYQARTFGHRLQQCGHHLQMNH